MNKMSKKLVIPAAAVFVSTAAHAARPLVHEDNNPAKAHMHVMGNPGFCGMSVHASMLAACFDFDI